MHNGGVTKQLTPDQIVAANLRRAREVRGLSQKAAGEAFEPYLGEAWSKARVSQAERVDRDKVRGFTANELQAFSQAFDLPVMWFLLPDPDALPEQVGSEPVAEYLGRVWPLPRPPGPSGGPASDLYDRLAGLAYVAGWDVGEKMKAAADPIAAVAMIAAAPDLHRVQQVGDRLMETQVELIVALAELRDFIEGTYSDMRDAAFGVMEGEEE